MADEAWAVGIAEEALDVGMAEEAWPAGIVVEAQTSVVHAAADSEEAWAAEEIAGEKKTAGLFADVVQAAGECSVQALVVE